MYRNKYLIGVYAPIEEGETLLALCQNTQEFAELMGINVRNATKILSLLYTKKTNHLRFFGKICTVEFILEVE